MDPFFMTVHFKHSADLRKSYVLSIAHGDDLIKSFKNFKAREKNLLLIKRMTSITDGARKEMQRVNVLENVRVLGRDEYHV